MWTKDSTPTKHGVWNPMPELAKTSPFVDSRVDSNKTWCMGPYVGVDYILIFRRLKSRLQQKMVNGTLCQSWLLPYLMWTKDSTPTKHGVWNPMPELTITLPYVNQRFDSNKTWCMEPYAGIDYNLTFRRLKSCLQQNMLYGTLCRSWLQTHLMSTQELNRTKHGVWDPMLELTITSPYDESIVDSNKTWCMRPYAGVDYNPNLCRLLCRLQQNMVYGTL